MIGVVDAIASCEGVHGRGYTFVNALTANLPAVTAVQVLVEGKERDTLAGHIDLRRPLAKNLAWVR